MAAVSNGEAMIHSASLTVPTGLTPYLLEESIFVRILLLFPASPIGRHTHGQSIHGTDCLLSARDGRSSRSVSLASAQQRSWVRLSDLAT